MNNEKVDKLCEYINSLPDFTIRTEIDGNYDHMGATITDAFYKQG